MDTATARVEPEILDLLQTIQPVRLDLFRLLSDCDDCQRLAALPATPEVNDEIRGHIVRSHRDLVII